MLEDVMGPAWSALTASERICWHFTGQRNPILDLDGTFFTLNGWQFYVDTNSPLAVVNPTLMLTEPPTDKKPPNTDPLHATMWPLPGKLATGGSAHRAPVKVAWGSPGPPNTAVIIKQGYTQFRGNSAKYPINQRITATFADHQTWITTGITGEYLTTGVATAQRETSAKKNKKPSVRHVTTYQLGDAEVISLNDPKGYYATTAGENKFATIKGMTARRRPDLPLGRVTFINLDNGEIIEQTIPNPTGGSPSQISRPRHFP